MIQPLRYREGETNAVNQLPPSNCVDGNSDWPLVVVVPVLNLINRECFYIFVKPDFQYEERQHAHAQPMGSNSALARLQLLHLKPKSTLFDTNCDEHGMFVSYP